MKFSMLWLAVVALTTIGLSACDKEQVESSAEFDQTPILFGSFYGECQGESCIEIYKLDTQAQTLQEDTKDAYPRSDAPYDGTFAARSLAEYTLVKDLVSQIPAELLREKGPVIGSPDAGDWGGYYVEVQQAGQRRFWLIDTQKRNLPVYLHAFTDTLKVRLSKLR
ncbi:hypothetical protein [Hymenobacter chitinivorans]|uniref:Lipoprotein n=1 Tax=Hymenobacter chitinivorans DSM 11115 TaxID=1121954 RepID=A0A2M9BAL4_9BACT|nr:hypothetical protein [Hymenobacter chitinivorans]PJJ54975.1 hypothetical protein CLV45_3323 [Hymenobacter chitinivorans DSM 11115]